MTVEIQATERKITVYTVNGCEFTSINAARAHVINETLINITSRDDVDMYMSEIGDDLHNGHNSKIYKMMLALFPPV